MPIPMTLGKLTLPCSMQPERQHEVSKKYWSNKNRNIGAKTSAAVFRQSMAYGLPVCKAKKGTNRGRYQWDESTSVANHQWGTAKFPKCCKAQGRLKAVERLIL